MFDKRDEFAFSVVRMPYIDSNIPSYIFYGTIMSEIIRIARCTLLLEDLIPRLDELCKRMLNQGQGRIQGGGQGGHGPLQLKKMGGLGGHGPPNQKTEEEEKMEKKREKWKGEGIKGTERERIEGNKKKVNDRHSLTELVKYFF